MLSVAVLDEISVLRRVAGITAVTIEVAIHLSFSTSTGVESRHPGYG
jgi:hypothetical protein